MNLYICKERHVSAPDNPGGYLFFCRTCAGPVEPVSDELPFKSRAKFHQAGDGWSYEIGEPGSRLIVEGFADQERAMEHFINNQHA